MQLPFYTLRNAELPHQVVLFNQTGNASVMVSCNCRKTVNRFNKVLTYEPMGKTRNLDESRALYNDPNNHRIPFSKEDEAKW